MTTHAAEELEFWPLDVELEVLFEVSLARGDDAALVALEGADRVPRVCLRHVAALDVHLEVGVLVGAHVVTQRTLHLLLLQRTPRTLNKHW